MGFIHRGGAENAEKFIFSHPDEIRATTISSRLNKGNKDLTGQVGQADSHRFTRLNKISFYEIRF